MVLCHLPIMTCHDINKPRLHQLSIRLSSDFQVFISHFPSRSAIINGPFTAFTPIQFPVISYLPISSHPKCASVPGGSTGPGPSTYEPLGVGEVNASASRLELRVPPNGSTVVEVDFRWGKNTNESKSNAVTEPVQNLELTHADCWFFAFMIIN